MTERREPDEIRKQEGYESTKGIKERKKEDEGQRYGGITGQLPAGRGLL